MKFGIFYEHQLPRPWDDGAELRLFQEALDQVELADRLGLDYAWEVEHHFLEEYSHSSAPEVFLSACAALTKRIRLGHGIRQVIPNYNHPARTAECLGTLDIISNGRLEFGIGEGATRLETVVGDTCLRSRSRARIKIRSVGDALCLDQMTGEQQEQKPRQAGKQKIDRYVFFHLRQLGAISQSLITVEIGLGWR